MTEAFRSHSVGRDLVPARTCRIRRSVRAGSASFEILMYTVYVLKDKNGKLYKGVTNNLERRLIEHMSGRTITTSRMKELMVVYKELYDNFETARKRELYFKTGAGRRFLKKFI